MIYWGAVKMNWKKIITGAIITILLVISVTEGILLKRAYPSDDQNVKIGFSLDNSVSGNGKLSDADNLERINLIIIALLFSRRES